MSTKLVLQWTWQWYLNTPDSLHIVVGLHEANGSNWGPSVSSNIMIGQLPDGSKESLFALAKWSQAELGEANQSPSISLPEGTEVQGVVEVGCIVYYSATRQLRADGHVRYSRSVTTKLPALAQRLTDLPPDICELVTALDAPVHDFALDLILKQFDGAPATQQIPPSLRWVFVCYHAGDEEFARRLATRLERTGVFHAFFLPWQIGWGQSLRKVLDAGLEKCNAGIVVFTPEFLGDGWRDYEYSGLISKKVNEGSKVGYALLRGDHSDVPHALQDYFYADFRDPGQFEREFLKIYRGLLGRPLEERPASSH